MKLGIVGKGGVGKTSTSALLTSAFVRRGQRVLAIDTDSNTNLGLSLGLDMAQTEAVPVMPRSLIVGDGGDMTVDELLADFGRATPAGATLLSAIKVAEAGAGCTCSGHATVRNLLGQAMDTRADITLVDMEAGLEHLSRSGGTLAHADVLLVVMEPTRKSILTAARTVALAADLGLHQVYGVGNKARLPEDAEYFRTAAAEQGVPLAGIIPLDPQVSAADRDGTAVSRVVDGPAHTAVEEIVDFLQELSVSA
ncbi:carbon monoxide dehydrogenase accessory protein CooC [soil metagenome]